MPSGDACMHTPGCTLHGCHADSARIPAVVELSDANPMLHCNLQWLCIPLRFGLHHSMVTQHTQTKTLFVNSNMQFRYAILNQSTICEF